MKKSRRILVPACSLLFVALLALTVSRVWKHDPMAELHRLLNDSAVTTSEEIDQVTKQKVLANYGKLPMRFEANDGQFDEQVKFVTRGSGYTMFLTENEAVLSLRKAEDGEPGAERKVQSETGDQQPATSNEQPASTTVRMKLANANPNPAVTAQDELPGKTNYFRSNDPSKWRTNVPSYKKVRFAEVYPGVDMVYYGNQRRLEYDFVVQPGADPNVIALEFAGLTASETKPAVEITSSGDLLLHTEDGVIQQNKPIIYQEIAGERLPVEGEYRLLADATVGFEVAAYDVTEALVIDPVLVYATYLGGSGREESIAVAADGSGNAYVVGETVSTDFPTMNAFDNTLNDGIVTDERDFFVTKFSSDGQSLVYSTYIGGTGGEVGNPGIAVDGAGSAYITGETMSFDYPTVNAFQGSHSGGASRDIVVTKFSPDGASLVYSTYLGGTGEDQDPFIAVDGAGQAYVGGETDSPDFPTANAFDGVLNDGVSTTFEDLFVTKFSSDGMSLVFSTYLGGARTESAIGFGREIAVDGAGSVYVAGETRSIDYPTVNAFDATLNDGVNTSDDDYCVTKFSPDGQSLVYSTYLGGSGSDIDAVIAVDGAGNAYVAGRTLSTDFPTVNAFDTDLNDGVNTSESDVTVTKFSSDGMSLVYSTYFGGTLDESEVEIDVDGSGNVYIAGRTFSTDLPTVAALDGTLNDGVNTNDSDVFVAQFDNSGGTLLFSTYLGGTLFEGSPVITLDGLGNAYIVGETNSTDFPTLNPFDGTLNDGVVTSQKDAFLVKIGGFPPDETGKTFVFFADEQVKIDGTVVSSGDIHSNGNISFDDEEEGTHTGNLSARDDITIAKDVTIVGNAIAGDDIYEFGDITGTTQDHASVAAIPLPSFNFGAGGPSKTVPKKGSLTLSPGSYGKVKVLKNAKLFLSAGDYFFKILDTDPGAMIFCDVTNGEVKIHVVSDLDFDDKVKVKITGAGAATEKVTFITLQDPKVDIGEKATVQGNIIAQDAEVHFSEESKFKGAVCAEKITVDPEVSFSFHSPGVLAKDSEDDDSEAADEQSPVTSYQLEQNYPNPFNPSTKIQFSVLEAGAVQLSIYNLQGQIVRTLVSGQMNPGRHDIIWNGRDNAGKLVPSGVYLYKLRVNGFEETRRMTLMK